MDDKWHKKYTFFINFRQHSKITNENIFEKKQLNQYVVGETLNATLCIQLKKSKKVTSPVQGPLQLNDQLPIHKLVVQSQFVEDTSVVNDKNVSTGPSDCEIRCYPFASVNEKWRKKVSNF